MALQDLQAQVTTPTTYPSGAPRMEQAGGYCPAAVCERGHTATSKADYREPPSRCATCGARVLIACPHCKYRIQGAKIGIGSPYSPPDFCDRCGEPFPWLSRAGRVYLLQNLLDGEDLDEASRLEVREELDALARSDVPADEQLRRWSKVKQLAPHLWQAGQSILVSVVTAEAKKSLGLPPA